MKEAILNFLRNSPSYLSGEDLSHHLKVSRAGIWKSIQELRKDGYEIEAIPHCGYKLVSAPDKLFPEEIQSGLDTRFIGRKIHHYESLDSTNDTAFKLAVDSAAEGTLVVAEGQHRGRGRMGRQWISPKAKGIYFSLILRPKIIPNEAPRLTLLTAVAVAEAIRKATGLAALIKWPNDILIGEKKLGGILTELNAEVDRVKFIIIGVGINVNLKKTQLPFRATSVRNELGKNFSRVELLRQILTEMERHYLQYSREGFSPIIEKWKHLSATLGKRVKVTSSKGEVEGQAMELDADGALLVRQDSGFMERVVSGDVMRLR
jgi:BirA family transcriptional regulator, biotin operon repressor / biotin---[acetyl-CoA-carboxylase] ligase